MGGARRALARDGCAIPIISRSARLLMGIARDQRHGTSRGIVTALHPSSAAFSLEVLPSRNSITAV